MLHNRFPKHSHDSSPPNHAAGFVLCPMVIVQNLAPVQQAWQAVYQLAYEQSRAALQPSLPERDLLGVWN